MDSPMSLSRGMMVPKRYSQQPDMTDHPDLPDLPANLRWEPFDSDSREDWAKLLQCVLTDEEIMLDLSFHTALGGKHAILVVIGEDEEGTDFVSAPEEPVVERFRASAVRQCFEFLDPEDTTAVCIILVYPDGSYVAGVGGGSF